MSLLLFQAFFSASVPAPRPAVVVTPFDALVEQVDRLAMSHLGGTSITYRPLGGAAVPVTGIFDAQFLLAKGDADAGVETLGPAVFLRVSDLPADPELDDPTITIAGVAYRVLERRPDGSGGIVLPLRMIT